MFTFSESCGNRLFAHNRYDSLTDAENADDWLKFQLNKLKAKRENNPEVLRRKRQEKLLLEVRIFRKKLYSNLSFFFFKKNAV